MARYIVITTTGFIADTARSSTPPGTSYCVYWDGWPGRLICVYNSERYASKTKDGGRERARTLAQDYADSLNETGPGG